MKVILPKNIIDIMSKINNSGFDAHLVGGCVRDLIMGRTPNDWDIATNASTDAIKSIFPKSYDTGLKHGTVTVLYDRTKAEITTYRKESVYSDHRRPDFVIFTDSLTEDLSRRDFTVNSIAWHPKKGLTDPFNGLQDINKGIIRCVGDPKQRFSEDALRMLRAVRFSAQLGFDIEDKTFSAIRDCWQDLSYVSAERIQSELNKILDSKEPHKLSMLWETGLSRVIFPEIDKLDNEWTKYAVHFSNHRNKRIILLSLLFITTFKDLAGQYYKRILKKLRYDNKTIKSIGLLINCFDGLGAYSCRNLRKAVTEFGKEKVINTIEINAAMKKLPYDVSASIIDDLTTNVTPVKASISGTDLKNAGLCDGPGIGKMLSLLLYCIFEKPELNNFDTLLLLAKAISKSRIFVSFNHEINNRKGQPD